MPTNGPSHERPQQTTLVSLATTSPAPSEPLQQQRQRPRDIAQASEARVVATAVINTLVSEPQLYLHGRVATDHEIRPRPVRTRGMLDGACFSSGATNYPDLVALSYLHADVGINAWDASDRIIDRARTHVIDGGRVFFDSGAFHEAGRPDVSIDFRQVFARYDRLLEGMDRETAAGVTLVMPDQIFNQAGSLQRLRTHRDLVRGAIARGADCLIPVQKPDPAHPERGVASLSEMYRAALAEIGVADGEVRPALPAKKSACDLPDVTAFMREAQPRGMHLLGRSLASPRNAHWMASIRAVAPGATVSSDACEVTALLGDGRSLTDRQRHMRDAVTGEILDRYGYDAETAMHDLYHAPGTIDRACALRLGNHLRVAERLPELGADPLQAFVEATQQATTPDWEARMRRLGWDGGEAGAESDAAAAAVTGYRCQAGHIIDLLGPHAAPAAGRFILAETSTEVGNMAGRLIRGMAAYYALGEARERRSTQAVCLQQDIFGGFSPVGR